MDDKWQNLDVTKTILLGNKCVSSQMLILREKRVFLVVHYTCLKVICLWQHSPSWEDSKWSKRMIHWGWWKVGGGRINRTCYIIGYWSLRVKKEKKHLGWPQIREYLPHYRSSSPSMLLRIVYLAKPTLCPSWTCCASTWSSPLGHLRMPLVDIWPSFIDKASFSHFLCFVSELNQSLPK